MADWYRIKDESPIHLESSVPDEHKKTKVKLPSEDDEGKKVSYELPQDDHSSLEFTLMVIYYFEDFAKDHDLSSEDKFKHFKTVMRPGVAKDLWKSVIDVFEDDDESEEAWTAAIEAYIEARVGNKRAFERLHNYLRAVKKPRKMTPQELLNRYRTILLYAAYLPDAREFSPNEKKNMYIGFFPNDQQEQCHRKYTDLSDVTLDDLKDYFSTFRKPTDSYDKSSHKRRTNPNGNNYRNNFGARNVRSRRNNFNNNNGRRRLPNDEAMALLPFANTDPHAHCPRHPHGTHLWGACTTNPNSPNYIPPRNAFRTNRNANHQWRNTRGHRPAGNPNGQQPPAHVHYGHQPPAQNSYYYGGDPAVFHMGQPPAANRLNVYYHGTYGAGSPMPPPPSGPPPVPPPNPPSGRF